MVALKVIKAGMDTKEVLARFEAERQAVALMDHPNIAKVLDAGATNTGRPYFAMELVKGVPITTVLRRGRDWEQRNASLSSATSARPSTTPTRRAIIHRDIKPSNVMVTMHGDKPGGEGHRLRHRQGHPRASSPTKPSLPNYDQFIGTPVYMSPEQASLSGLDLDTRSDIYGLGVLAL